MFGMGKSTLLVNLLIEHIRQGHDGLFIDPHGDTAAQIARPFSELSLSKQTYGI